MSNRIPPLIEPYLAFRPEASLILLTGVLGASTNWLVLRFLYSALTARDVLPPDQVQIEGQGQFNVLLVSFMRDFVFWKDGARRLGLDLDKLALQKRFAFVDGLTGLYLPNQQRRKVGHAGVKILQDPALSSLADEIRSNFKSFQGSQDGGPKTILVIDQLDLLLAMGSDEIGAVALEQMMLGLREGFHVTVMTLSADAPLVLENQTPLETHHAAFLLSTSHQAGLVMSLRLLDSGTARDISGVVRITPRDQVTDSEAMGEKELLYFVGGDGGVTVFERG